jgi:alpha-glucosidase (family GH31 glycosyl hydrolase)
MRTRAICLTVVIGAAVLTGAITRAGGQTRPELDLPFEDGERWWAGVISRAHLMPLDSAAPVFEANLSGDTFGNQVQPLLLSTTGRYVWSEDPFRLEIANGRLHITAPESAVRSGRFGTSLGDAVRQASTAYYPPSGSTPDPSLFTRPQFNTWIEFTYNQTQSNVLSYAHAIVDHGFAPGVLMIDEGWAEGYGHLEFHRGRFPDPAAMMRELHGLGFKVMLWVSPYIQADGPRFAAMSHDKSRTVWLRNAVSPDEPVLVRWWDGFSAITDVTNPEGISWYEAQLRHLVDAYGVDGFKFDGGDAELFARPALQGAALAYAKDATPNRLTEAYARLGLAFPLNEFRACWKMGGRPLAQRLRDKEHTWKDLQTLVPGMLNLGIVGYPYACPDMIGGGEYLSFQDRSTVDEELIVRGAQVHALMPMMQFSVAPWRVLSPEHLAITQRMAALHTAHGDDILALARAAATSGEPIARALEYAFPHMGYEDVVDEFLLGPDLLVAPVVERGARERRLVVPPGRWRGDDGSEVTGPATVTIRVPLERLPFYRRLS